MARRQHKEESMPAEPLRMDLSKIAPDAYRHFLQLLAIKIRQREGQTLDVIKQVEHQYLDNEKDAVEGVFAVNGFSFAGQGQNVGLAFVSLDQKLGFGCRDVVAAEIPDLAPRRLPTFRARRQPD